MIEIWLKEFVAASCPVGQQGTSFTVTGFVDPASVQVQGSLDPGAINGQVVQTGNGWTCQFVGVPPGSYRFTAQGSDGSSDGCDVVVGGCTVELSPGEARGSASGYANPSSGVESRP
jgi:hypothetical protein